MNLLKEMNEREESQNDNWSKGSVKSRKGPVPPSLTIQSRKGGFWRPSNRTPSMLPPRSGTLK